MKRTIDETFRADDLIEKQETTMSFEIEESDLIDQIDRHFDAAKAVNDNNACRLARTNTAVNSYLQNVSKYVRCIDAILMRGAKVGYASMDTKSIYGKTWSKMEELERVMRELLEAYKDDMSHTEATESDLYAELMQPINKN